MPILGALVAAVGAIALAIGATGGNDVVTIAGGVLLGLGILAVPILIHVTIDHGMYGRLEALEQRAELDKE